MSIILCQQRDTEFNDFLPIRRQKREEIREKEREREKEQNIKRK